MNYLVSSGGAAVLSAMIIQYIKKAHWLTAVSTRSDSSFANLMFSIMMAGFAASTVTFAYSSAYHEVIIGNVDFAGVFNFAGRVFVQWCAQHASYKAFVVPTELQAANIDVLNQLLDQLKSNRDIYVKILNGKENR